MSGCKGTKSSNCWSLRNTWQSEDGASENVTPSPAEEQFANTCWPCTKTRMPTGDQFASTRQTARSVSSFAHAPRVWVLHLHVLLHHRPHCTRRWYVATRKDHNPKPDRRWDNTEYCDHACQTQYPWPELNNCCLMAPWTDIFRYDGVAGLSQTCRCSGSNIPEIAAMRFFRNSKVSLLRRNDACVVELRARSRCHGAAHHKCNTGMRVRLPRNASRSTTSKLKCLKSADASNSGEELGSVEQCAPCRTEPRSAIGMVWDIAKMEGAALRTADDDSACMCLSWSSSAGSPPKDTMPSCTGRKPDNVCEAKLVGCLRYITTYGMPNGLHVGYAIAHLQLTTCSTVYALCPVRRLPRATVHHLQLHSMTLLSRQPSCLRITCVCGSTVCASRMCAKSSLCVAHPVCCAIQTSGSEQRVVLCAVARCPLLALFHSRCNLFAPPPCLSSAFSNLRMTIKQ